MSPDEASSSNQPARDTTPSPPPNLQPFDQALSEVAKGKKPADNPSPSPPPSNSQVLENGGLSEVARGKQPACDSTPSPPISESQLSEAEYYIPEELSRTNSAESSSSQKHHSEDAIFQPSTSATAASQQPGTRAPRDRRPINIEGFAIHHGSRASPFRHLYDIARCWGKAVGLVRYHINYMTMTQHAYFIPRRPGSDDYIIKTSEVSKHYELPSAQINADWNQEMLEDRIQEYVTW